MPGPDGMDVGDRHHEIVAMDDLGRKFAGHDPAE
jgi:hypothetical protein